MGNSFGGWVGSGLLLPERPADGAIGCRCSQKESSARRCESAALPVGQWERMRNNRPHVSREKRSSAPSAMNSSVPTPAQLADIDDEELVRLAVSWRAQASRGDREAF